MQERFHHRQDAFVPDPSAHPVHQGRMVDHVEARLDVTFQHPLIGAGGELVNLCDRVLGSPSRTEAIRAWLEVRLEDRLEHQFEGRLHGAVPRGRDAKPSQLGAGLGIIRSRTARAVNRRAFRSCRSCGKNCSSAERIDCGRSPSTPAARFPLLPLTRAHATTRTAGSHTRLNRSSNRRSGSSIAHRCNLIWIRSTWDSANSRSGHSTSVFTGDLPPFQTHDCELAAALRQVTGFPGLGLLRRLRHVPGR